MTTAMSQEPRGAKGSQGEKTLAPLGRLADALSPKWGGNKPPFGEKQHLVDVPLGQGEAPNFLRSPLGSPPDNEAKGSQGEEWDFEDRVMCNDCLFFKQDMVTQKMPVEQWDKLVRVNHPAHRWMFEMAKVVNGWTSVTYARKACHGGEPAPMPEDLKHRCDYFSPLNKSYGIKTEKTEWWE